MWGRRMESRYFSIFLAFMFSISTSAVASAGQEIRITSDDERGFCPAIYDNKIIWLDKYFDGSIYVRDLFTGEEKQIAIDPWYSSPIIYDDKIVWESGGQNIYLYNISTDNKTLLSIPDLENQGAKYSLAIYCDKILWVDWSDGNEDIYMYDLSTCNKTRITTNRSTKNPAIYDDKIVWQDYRYGWKYGDIYIYNLSTSTETQVTTNRSASNPKVYNDRIVYMENNNIYLYNLSTSMETQISFNGSLEDHPAIYSNRNLAIYGDRIVWQDHRNGNWDIYMYDLSINKETQITTSGSASCPAIYGDRIMWEDYRNDRENMYYCSIYMYDFSAKPAMPFASFSTNITSKSGNMPLTVLFTYNSSGGTPTSWYWDFGDGINSKNAQTATHTFTKPGIYDVSLTVTNAEGSSTLNKLNCITVTPPQAPIADFFSPEVYQAGIYARSLLINETVSFIDNSTGSPTSWLWDFGDGVTSTAQNPTYIYNESGGYIVTLTVGNEIDSDTLSKHGYVIVNTDDYPIYPDNFTSNVTSGTAPLTVLFITGDYAYGWDWNFGDGTYSGNRTPIHTYSKPGKYTVRLHSYDVGGQSMITKHNYINVTDPNVPLVDFSANTISGPAPLVVLFTDTSNSTASTSWLWDFGDGINSKHTMNATHTFIDPGVYDVTLTVTDKAGNYTMKKSSYITVTS
ncbi:PKD domain-containing protein [Methanosarcina sp.]|uniref:PKD domain-containing protein n=1 Tax=Methanosarcina sp. TaxID=2213 RepID=UPI002ABA3870|nr:PKD domain-containing protein [Methanosarcina sp.]MDY9927697.1 PKD domain-containing protein [Methanosarcina sp.]